MIEYVAEWLAASTCPLAYILLHRLELPMVFLGLVGLAILAFIAWAALAEE